MIHERYDSYHSHTAHTSTNDLFGIELRDPDPAVYDDTHRGTLQLAAAVVLVYPQNRRETRALPRKGKGRAAITPASPSWIGRLKARTGGKKGRHL